MSMLLAAPYVFAADDDVVVFGGEFDEQPPVEPPAVEPPPTEQPPIEQPPIEQPPVEQPAVEPPAPIETQPVETKPLEEPPPSNDQPVEPEPVVEPQPVEPTLINDPPSNGEREPSGNRSSQTQPVAPQPIKRPIEPQLLNEPPSNIESEPSGSRSSRSQPAEPQRVERPSIQQPVQQPAQQPAQPTVEPQPLNELVEEDDYIDVGKTINFNKLPSSNPAAQLEQTDKPVEPKPVEPIKPEPSNEVVEPDKKEITEPFKDLTPTEPVTIEPKVDQPQPSVDDPFERYRDQPSTDNPTVKPVEPTPTVEPPITMKVEKKGKKLKPRFVKLTSDDSFDYYLDQSSVQWKNLPYSASEYMADVWIRMLDKQDSTADLPNDLRDYINDQSDDEVSLAEAKGLIYDPVDVKVLRTKKYFLEHYYIRPQRRQIQFLCELDVVGRPQNAISERKYDYKNWEELIPGSIETAIYYGVLDVIGKSKASARGHMTATDMLEEYARIAVH